MCDTEWERCWVDRQVRKEEEVLDDDAWKDALLILKIGVCPQISPPMENPQKASSFHFKRVITACKSRAMPSSVISLSPPAVENLESPVPLYTFYTNINASERIAYL